MKRLAFIPAFALACTASAQILLVQPGKADPMELCFNPQFIARNGITLIKGELFTKRDNEPMRPRNENHIYRFDAQGRTTYSNHSYGRPGSGLDTASVSFEFDGTGSVTRRLRNDLSGYFAYDIKRDEKGRPVQETYTRIENLGTDRYQLQPGTITEISDEHFRYETVNDSVWKRIHVNSLGLPYREEVHISDGMGYLRAIEDRYLVNSRRSRISFNYDEKGRLSERIEQPDLASPRTIRRTWSYDTVGNVTDGTLWHDEVQKNREEYLYDEQTMLLKARLTLDKETGTIHVIRYSWERSRATQP